MFINNNDNIANVKTIEEEINNKQIVEKVLQAIKNPEIRKEMILAIKLDEDVIINGLTFASTDYGAFSTLPGNRELNPNNLQKLDLSISKHGYRSSQPITLNALGQTLNGQHRQHICQQKKIPVFFNFERTHVNSLELTVDMNISQRNWGLKDYIHSFSERGFQDYINLLNLISAQKIPISLALWLIYHSRNGNVQELVKSGKFKCSDSDVEIVKRVLISIREIKDTIPNNLPYEKSLRNAFLSDKIAVPLAVLMEEENYSQARMLKQIMTCYKSVDKRNMSSCGESLVSIYNYRLKDTTNKLRAYSEMGKLTN